MNSNHLLLAGICIALFFSACKKSNDNQPAVTIPATYPDYSSFNVGNYWVYEEFLLDSTGTATSLNRFDSCYVEKDTMINNQTYFKICKLKYNNPTQPEISFQRDSLDYIVTSEGEILFSSQDFTTVFSSYYFITLPSDTLCLIEKKMTDKDQTITTPAGIFTTSNAKQTFYMYPNWSNFGTVRVRNNRYAENIGLITETLPFYVSDPNYIERKLARYHLN
ncbi:MAG TPA: hypothetical protein VFW78_05930 [Bacteroidia bacterium]|nr:hypothetical protein [Bacteroidia bacterium]